jgi:hypothetical protein
MTRVHRKPKQERNNKMKNPKAIFTSTVLAIAFVLALGAQASPHADGGPTYLFSTASSNRNNDGENDRENLPLITIHSTDNVTRGKTGSFVLAMQAAVDTMPAFSFGGRYVNFKVSGTAIAGVDYVLLVSPIRIGQSGYGVIQVQTLPDPRASSFHQAYSVVITLESGAGYELGAARSATMWIKP